MKYSTIGVVAPKEEKKEEEKEVSNILIKGDIFLTWNT